jgi:hypothetical protein
MLTQMREISPMTKYPENSRETRFGSLAIILAAATLLVMGRLCTNEFTWWDDNITISLNPRLNPPTLSTLVFYWTHSEYRLYAPLTYTLWAGLALIARVTPDTNGISLNPIVFHSASVLLHLLAALVVCNMLVLLRMSWFAALCGALVFAVHPIQVEAVAWASGLKDVLSGLLAITALWQYLRFALEAQKGERSVLPLLLSLVFLILAMLAKSSAATVPLAALAIDRWIVGRNWKSIFGSTALLAAAALPFVVVATIVKSTADLPLTPLWQRPLIACDSLMFYIRQLIWPIHLCIDYGRTPKLAMHQRLIAVVWLVPAAIAFGLIAVRKRAPFLIAAALVFCAGCLPNLGLMTFVMQFYSTTADHYLYWAMLGPAMAIAWTLDAFPTALLMRGVIVTALLAASILSFRQGGFWKDDFSLFEHVIELNPNSFLAYNDLGNAYDRESNASAAAADFQLAIAIKPDYAIAHSNLAAALHQMGRLDATAAELQSSISIQQSQPPGLRKTLLADLNRLGQDFLEEGQPARAAEPLRQSLKLNPDQPDVISMLNLAESRMIHPTTSTIPSSVHQ